MKLFYASGACSLSPHIVLRELGLKFELEKVDIGAKKTESGLDFWKVNGKGYVPVLEVKPGEYLTEGVAILQYLNSIVPDSKLAPKFGTLEYFRVVEWLTFISSEIHKGFGPLFAGPNPAALEKLEKRLAYVADRLQGQYLLGEHFTLADAYMFTVLRWAEHVKVDLGKFPGLKEYRERVEARPKVREALEAEGLLNPAHH